MGQGAKVLRAISKRPSGSSGGGRDDVKRQVDNQEGKQKPIYELVNVKNGGGKLVELIKSSAKLSRISSLNSSGSADSSQNQERTDQEDLGKRVDNDIEALVLPLLYNGGRGKLVPLDKICRLRFGLTSVDDTTNPPDDDDHCDEVANGVKCRWVCWRLDERGFVGETALHICFLLSTPTHMILAKRLLSLFPMLIYDIYTCDEYFGESALHMSIVNEDVRMVKLLLDRGANVHERCLGSFWLPDDQKAKTNAMLRKLLCTPESELTSQDRAQLQSIDLNSNHFGNQITDYNGYLYWGEYALSFAACLGLHDCYKLLLAKGANPNRQDSNGNTTLHMTVIANRRDMFDLCYSNGANLTVLNKQNLSPLQLAAKLRRVDLFFHILSIQRQVNWVFCNVGFVEVPLKGLDSISEADGSCDQNSVLSIVVSGGSNEHLQMLDGCLSDLLQTKWDCVVREKFYWWLYQFLLFLLVASFAYIKRFAPQSAPVPPNPQTLKSVHNQSIVVNNDYNSNHHRDWPLFLIISQVISQVHSNSEYLLLAFVLYYLWFTFWRLIKNSGSLMAYRESLLQAPEMSLFTFTCFLILACIPVRLLEWTACEEILASLIMFMLPLKLLFFCRASLSVGSFVVMIYKIVVNDVLCFVVFLIIFVAGFSQSFLIMFKSYNRDAVPAGPAQDEENHFVSLFDGLISMHMMALNEFGIVLEQFQGTHYQRLSKFMFCLYMILVSILLINMLIAMLGKTYQDIAGQPNESLRQWARALLILERMCTAKDRLRVLNRYSRANSTAASRSGRFYGSTWPLRAQDRAQIERLRKLREENRHNGARLSRLQSTEDQ